MIAGALLAFAMASPAAELARSRDMTLERQLVDREMASWVAWQRMDAAFWQEFLSDDHIEVSGFVGAVGKKSVIAGIANKVCRVSSYKVDRFQFYRLDERTAVLIYRAEQDTTCGKMKVPSPVWATSLYQLRGGRWQNVLYEHTPALEPPKKPSARNIFHVFDAPGF